MSMPFSTRDPATLDLYNRACAAMHAYRGDPLALLDEALAAAPGFAMGWAMRASILALSTDASYFGQALADAQACLGQPHANSRERAFAHAAMAFAEGRHREAAALWGRISMEYPKDLLALQLAHTTDFLLGQNTLLRDRPAAARRAWSPDEPGFGYLLGMHAFGLEECGDYDAAEREGRRGAELDPHDGWSTHAVAHVYEMRGDVDSGAAWLRDNAHAWAAESFLAYHNWWHLALLHLERDECSAALDIYDHAIRPKPSSVMMEMVDASALLWRLHLRGAETGARFAEIADAWSPMAEQGVYAFNDVHAVMAFLGAGRLDDARRTLSALRRAAARDGDNGLASQRIGAPVADALIAFAEGRYGDAAETLALVRPYAHGFGGSHAQRDILSLTLVEAALRSGDRASAEAYAAERVALKPQSPFARGLLRRAQALT